MDEKTRPKQNQSSKNMEESLCVTASQFRMLILASLENPSFLVHVDRLLFMQKMGSSPIRLLRYIFLLLYPITFGDTRHYMSISSASFQLLPYIQIDRCTLHVYKSLDMTLFS